MGRRILPLFRQHFGKSSLGFPRIYSAIVVTTNDLLGTPLLLHYSIKRFSNRKVPGWFAVEFHPLSSIQHGFFRICQPYYHPPHFLSFYDLVAAYAIGLQILGVAVTFPAEIAV